MRNTTGMNWPGSCGAFENNLAFWFKKMIYKTTTQKNAYAVGYTIEGEEALEAPQKQAPPFIHRHGVSLRTQGFIIVG